MHTHTHTLMYGGKEAGRGRGKRGKECRGGRGREEKEKADIPVLQTKS